MLQRENPLIGLTTYGRNADSRFTLPVEYIDAVRRAGGVPVLIAPGETRWRSVIDAVDALILTGGGDVDPDAYGGRRHPTNYGVDLERDTLEFELGRWVLDSGLPRSAFAAARVLNIARGGKRSTHPGRIRRASCARRRRPARHPAQASSRLAGILGRKEFRRCRGTAGAARRGRGFGPWAMRRWHHQAIEMPDPGSSPSVAPG
jgi:putative glutamine amidotransferase